MDAKRAKEIMESYGVIDVRYQGSPVWLEQVHPDGATADVTHLHSEERMEVPLIHLFEDGTIE